MQHLYEIDSLNWQATYPDHIRNEAVAAVESGKIILLPQLAFQILPQEQKLFSSEFSSANSKNISLNPHTGVVRGADCDEKISNEIKSMLRRYGQSASNLINALFPTYQHAIQIGRTSFRPVEIEGRVPKSFRKDDTRLHVDAFPCSPTQGRRIFRVFTNVHPEGKERLWRVGEPFVDVAKRFLPQLRRPWLGRGKLLKALRITKGYCTEYDYLMLQLHDKMKADLAYQRQAPQTDVRFWPNSSWIVNTDHVSHAAMSGQFAFEQTFYLPVKAMTYPEFSPLRSLEKLTGRELV